MPQLYGPPPDPAQIAALVPTSAWAISLGIGAVLLGLAWLARRREWLVWPTLIASQVALLTAPLLGMVDRAVYGAYPTIDKQGSMLFYLDGVHRRLLLDPTDPAGHLIGLHVGHLWLVEPFDLVLTSYGAFNASAVLYVLLAWICAWWFLRQLCGDPATAFVLSLPFGLALHLFRDLNWYTIEKAAVFVLPLYAGCWLNAVRRGGHWRWAAAGVVLLAALLNLYLAVVIGIVAGFATLVIAGDALSRGERPRVALIATGQHHALASYAATLALVSPLIAAQALALQSGPLASPDCFLRTRVKPDSNTLWPPMWNRLEAGFAFHPLALVLGGWALLFHNRDRRVATLFAIGALAGLVSLGPTIGSFRNPVYWALWYAVPYFWRIAKPEVFAWPAWLAWLGLTALAVAARRPPAPVLAAIYAVMVVGWLGTTRTHPTWPGFSEYVPSQLDPDWQRHLSRQPECAVPAPTR